MLRFFCMLLAGWTGLAAPGKISAAREIPLSGNRITGFAVTADSLYVWGDGVFEINLRNGRQQRIAEGEFAEGGCFLDGGLILNSMEPRELLWMRLADRKRFVVDTGVDTRDAVAIDLLGHHGVLLIHKRQQVRYYDFPPVMKDHWNESELYTIYTPSTEGGIKIADIDGDGLPDLLCGNYWMKSPTRFELPWREFAIDTWNEEEGSAMLTLAWSGGNATSGGIRVAGQRDMRPARVAWFQHPADPRQLWEAHQLGQLQGVSGVIFIEKDLIVLERDAPGRLLLFRRAGDGFLAGKELIRTNQAVGMARLANGRVLLIEKSRVVLLPTAIFN